MPALRNYGVYISHGWDWKEEYYRLVELLNKAPLFNWTNYSIPEYDPIRTMVKKEEVERELDSHIRPVDIVIVLSGMYADHSDWMQGEIRVANKHDKPIVGVVPLGGHRVPPAIEEVALEIVDWNVKQIVDTIRKKALPYRTTG